MKKNWINTFSIDKQKYFVSQCSVIQPKTPSPEHSSHLIMLAYKSWGSLLCYKSIPKKKGRIESLIKDMCCQEMVLLSSIAEVKVSRQKNYGSLLITYEQGRPKAEIHFQKAYLAKIWMLLIKKKLIDQQYQQQVGSILQNQNEEDLSGSITFSMDHLVQNLTKQSKDQFLQESQAVWSVEQINNVLNTMDELKESPFELAKIILSKISALKIMQQLLSNQQKNKSASNSHQFDHNSKIMQKSLTKFQSEEKIEIMRIKYEQHIFQLQNQNKKLRQVSQQRLQHSTRVQQEIKNCQAQIIGLRDSNDIMIQQIQRNKSTIQDLQNRNSQIISSKDRQIQQKVAQILKRQVQMQNLSQQHKKEFQKIKQLNDKYLSENLHLQKQNQQKDLKIQSISAKIQAQNSTIQSQILKIQSLQEIVRRLQQSNQQLSRQISYISQNQRNEEKEAFLQQQNQRLLVQNQSLIQANLLHMFQGRILHNCALEKKFLQKEIEVYTNSKIKFTRVIYAYDQKNPTNYHQYIDQNPNFCLIVKLKNGRLIAGFSVSPVSQKTIASQGGLLFSLTEKKLFKLFQGKRSVTYDNFFLIFGNSQLRLKFGQAKFFTNFGIANSFYNSNGEKFTVLSGLQSSRQQLFDDYQVFQTYFE